MCPPVIMALSVITGIVGQVAQFQAQSEAAAEQTQRYEQNKINALDAAAHEQKMFNMRAMQEQDKTSEENRQGAIQAQEVASAQQASAAQSNVTGLSLDNLLADIYRKEGTNRMYRDANTRSTVAQLEEQKRGTNITAKGRINSMSPGQQPSPLGLVAGIVNTGVSAYRQFRTDNRA